VSPILTRPVREQLEHDRVIRQLQAKYKRKTDVIINPGNEQNQSISIGDLVVYPDLLVFAEGTKRLLVTVEVETGESVNPIEARAEWGNFSKLKVPMHLYVPPACVEAVKRICDEYQILVSELWTYTTTFDQVRFTLVNKSPDAPTVKLPPVKDTPPAVVRPAAGRSDLSSGSRLPARAPAPKPAARTALKAVVKAKPVAKAKAAPKPAAKTKAKPAPKKAAKPTLRPAQGRPEQSRGAKVKIKKK
jgi:hypothetical protein